MGLFIHTYTHTHTHAHTGFAQDCIKEGNRDLWDYLRSVVEDEDEIRADLLNEVFYVMYVCMFVCGAI